MSIPFLLVIALLFNLAHVSASDPKPNFTGSWTTKIVKQVNGADSVRHLWISYSHPKLKIESASVPLKTGTYINVTPLKHYREESVYYADGRVETGKSVAHNSPVKSMTQRIGEKFVTSTSVTVTRDGQEVTTDSTITHEVSADGQTLTETMTRTSKGGGKPRIYLYDRVGKNKGTGINGEWRERLVNETTSLTIEHNDPEIKVTRRVVSEVKDETDISIYYSDGRGETNETYFGPTKSVTKWNGNRLVVEVVTILPINGELSKLEQWTTWQLAKDGGSINEVTRNKGPLFPETSEKKQLYTRTSKS